MPFHQDNTFFEISRKQALLSRDAEIYQPIVLSTYCLMFIRLAVACQHAYMTSCVAAEHLFKPVLDLGAFASWSHFMYLFSCLFTFYVPIHFSCVGVLQRCFAVKL